MSRLTTHIFGCSVEAEWVTAEKARGSRGYDTSYHYITGEQRFLPFKCQIRDLSSRTHERIVRTTYHPHLRAKARTAYYVGAHRVR